MTFDSIKRDRASVTPSRARAPLTGGCHAVTVTGDRDTRESDSLSSRDSDTPAFRPGVTITADAVEVC